MSRRARLFQVDGKLPNLALMRVSASLKEEGFEVELRKVETADDLEPGLFDEPAERVYGSLIFQKSRPLAERLLEIYPDAVLGGTGWDLDLDLEDVGLRTTELDYDLYPEFRSSIGFTQRGCRYRCPFCVVPKKEGRMTPAATVAEVWRGEPYPRELVLLDNDFFGQPSWRDRVDEIVEGGFKVNLTQGINVRLVDEEIAEAIVRMDYRNTRMDEKRLAVAWDLTKDEKRVFRGLELLRDAGVPPSVISVYMLIGFWKGETEDDWEYRRRRIREFGAIPFPMSFKKTREERGFQVFCFRRYDIRGVSWEDFKRAKYRLPGSPEEDANLELELEATIEGGR